MSRPALRALPLLLAAGLAAAAADPTPPAGSVPPAESAAAPEKAPADPANLGRGLRYFRLDPAATEPAVAAALAAPALVLDLRLATDTPADLARLRDLFAPRDAAHPLFVLLGAATPAPLRAAVPAAPGVLTFAGTTAGFAADVTVAVDTETDHAAAAALAAGRPPRELTDEKIEKTRYDEARLAKNHANGRRALEPEEPAKGSKPPTATTAKPAAEADNTPKPAEPVSPPLQDLLLQRAIALHRALLALDRIPEHT